MYTMVGKIVKDGVLVGFRVIDLDTYNISDISLRDTKEIIRDISNLKINRAGSILGKSGKLERYVNIGDSDKRYTVLAVIKSNEQVIGYKVSDNDGTINNLKKSTVENLYIKEKVTNCRMNVNGLSLIKGTFHEAKLKEKREV